MLPRLNSTYHSGFTLIEALVTTTVLSLLMAGIAIGVLSLQRSFFASREFAEAQADQVRVCDYLQRDGRAATEVAISENGKAVTMKLPTESGGLVGLDLPGSLVSLLGGTTAPATKTIVYRFTNDEVIRYDGATRRSIATRLSRFDASQSGNYLQVNLAFRSTYGNRVGTEVSASKLLANVRLRSAATP